MWGPEEYTGGLLSIQMVRWSILAFLYPGEKTSKGI